MYELWIDIEGDIVLRKTATNRGWYPSANLDQTIAALNEDYLSWLWPPATPLMTQLCVLNSIDELCTDYPEYLI